MQCLNSWYAPKWEILQGISAIDLFVMPMYLLVIVFAGYLIKQKLYSNSVEGSYFLPALLTKLLSGLTFASIYYYYYRGGDTFWYYRNGGVFRDALRENPLLGIKLLWMKIGTYSAETLPYTNRIWSIWFKRGDTESVYLAKLIGIVEAISFPSYWLTTIVFATFSFIGTWLLYLTFVRRYPSKAKLFAVCILFVPSTLFWGSGILKDTVCIGALGWLIYSVDNLFSKKGIRVIDILGVLIGSKFLFELKAYILLAMLPALVIWIYSRYKPNSTAILLKYTLSPLFAALMIFAGALATSNLAESSAKYNPHNLEKRAEGFRSYHTYLAQTQGQSFYDLGDISYTPLGILSKSPAAFNVTYFRPYIWEVGEPLQFISAIESALILLFILYTLRKVGVGKSISTAFQNPDASMSLAYAIVFGVSVGLTAYNFGALVRFKIPGVPFLLIAFAIMLAEAESKSVAIKKGNG